MEFRLLRADEIDCRISICNQYGVGLLLYKDARCDQNILDETVGCMNWQRHHTRENANCIVSIWDDEKKQWIDKEDTGTESFTEKEKGLASDSFKRACFNWGIGRELYTAPDMFVRQNQLKTLKNDNNRWTCKDIFKVDEIQYDKRNIIYVRILNLKNNIFIEFGQPADALKQQNDVGKEKIGQIKAEAVLKRCDADGIDVDRVLKHFKIKSLSEMTERQHAILNQYWDSFKGISQ